MWHHLYCYLGGHLAHFQFEVCKHVSMLTEIPSLILSENEYLKRTSMMHRIDHLNYANKVRNYEKEFISRRLRKSQMSTSYFAGTSYIYLSNCNHKNLILFLLFTVLTNKFYIITIFGEKKHLRLLISNHFLLTFFNKLN